MDDSGQVTRRGFLMGGLAAALVPYLPRVERTPPPVVQAAAAGGRKLIEIAGWEWTEQYHEDDLRRNPWDPPQNTIVSRDWDARITLAVHESRLAQVGALIVRDLGKMGEIRAEKTEGRVHLLLSGRACLSRATHSPRPLRDPVTGQLTEYYPFELAFTGLDEGATEPLYGEPGALPPVGRVYCFEERVLEREARRAGALEALRATSGERR